MRVGSALDETGAAIAETRRRIGSALDDTGVAIAETRRRIGSTLSAARGGTGAALALARRAALPATGLVALALLLPLDDGTGPKDFGPLFETARQHAESPPAETTAVPAHMSERPASEPALFVPLKVQAQINARPWAHIRIDGVDVGPTPLSHALAPGVYRIEAEFPDGRNLQRRVEIGPEQRFVALP